MAKNGIRNVYRPAATIKRAYGFSRAPTYTSADIPTAAARGPGNLNAEQFRQQFAYEWFQFGDRGAGWGGQSNPAFVSGAAGRLMPMLQAEQGGAARILRGYIRRANYEAGDNLSKARLYFMFNPETITRDYVSYLDQGALDPFNTVFQSKNEIAPPSFMDFSFELFFDRQEEACDPAHPGVFVDYQYFDMVVRNVVPEAAEMSSSTLPDNGVMMVNPRDITVIFSPQLTVQGRPLNARVSFERFTHRMVPTRMRIALTIRVVYMGPVRAMQEYKAEVFAQEETIPLEEEKASQYTWTFEKLKFLGTTKRTVADVLDSLGLGIGSGTAGSAVPGAVVAPAQVQDYLAQAKLSGDANKKARASALQWAFNNVTSATRYDNGAGRKSLPSSADCSGLIACAYAAIGAYDMMGWGDFGDSTHGMEDALNAKPGTGQKISMSSAQQQGVLQPGDLMYRYDNNHVVFFVAYSGGGFQIFDAASTSSSPQVGLRTRSDWDYTYAVRPTPYGQQMAASQGQSQGPR